MTDEDGIRAAVAEIGRLMYERSPAFADLFGTWAFTAHMLGEDRLYAFSAKRCLTD